IGPPTSALEVIVNPAPFSRIPRPTLPEMVTCFAKTRRSRPRLPSRLKFSTKTVRLPPIFPADSKFTRSSNVRTFFATVPRIVRVFVNARIFPSTCPSTCSVCANPNTSPWTCPFTVTSCPNKNTSPSTVPSTFTRSPNRKISPLIVSSDLTLADSPLRVSDASAAGASANAAQSPANISASAEPRRRQHRHYLKKCDHGLPSFPEGALKDQQAQQVRPAKSRLFQLLLPGIDIRCIERVSSRRCQPKDQAPNPLHRFPRALLELRQPRRERFILFQHGSRQQPRFPLQRPQQRPAGRAVLRVRGYFQPTRAVQLPLDIQQARHFVQMLRLFRHIAHEAPPAASALELSSACRSSCRARSSTTPTKARRTPNASAISS